MIYVLKLEGNKYYVGRTDNVDRRYQDHKAGIGSSWTKLHKPINIEYVRNYENKFYEDMVVKIFMNRYGIDNVRGGSYSQINLDSIQRYMLQREINNANDKCFECGGNHFIRSCPDKKQAMVNRLNCIIGISKSLK